MTDLIYICILYIIYNTSRDFYSVLLTCYTVLATLASFLFLNLKNPPLIFHIVLPNLDMWNDLIVFF